MEETDKSSCDGNEEWSVLKGLVSAPKVSFHSLNREVNAPANKHMK